MQDVGTATNGAPCAAFPDIYRASQLSSCGQPYSPYSINVDDQQYLAWPFYRDIHAESNGTRSLFTILAVQHGIPVTQAWLESTLQIVLETHDPLNSPLAAGVMFKGPSAAEPQVQPEAQHITLRRSSREVRQALQGCQQEFMQGPHIYQSGMVWQLWRIHDDTAGSFMTGVAPFNQEPNGTFQRLDLVSSPYQTLGIVVPPRAPRSDLSSLQGLRFAVKDNYCLRGMRTSLCNAAYLSTSSPSDKTALIGERMIAAGAKLLGMTKLSSMIGREEPTEATHYQAPFNPRGDGYQSPAGSSSGSAAAVAAYDWIDYTVGTDTTGSARRPALVNGVFQMWPTYNAALLDGIVSVYKPWDAPAVFTRDLGMLKPVISTWHGLADAIPHATAKGPAVILYPTDYLPPKNEVQLNLVEALLVDLARSLQAPVRRVSIASLWEKTRPQEAGSESVQEYLQDAYVHTNFHDYYYYSTADFRRTYEQQYRKRPYVNRFVNWKWELGSAVTEAERSEGIQRLEVYRK